MARQGVSEYVTRHASKSVVPLKWVVAVEALVNYVDPNILVWINESKGELVIEGILENFISKLEFPVLNILHDISKTVRLNYVAVKTDKTNNNYLIVSGLEPIMSKQYALEQALAQARGDNVFKAFEHINNNTVPKLTDELSKLSLDTKTTGLVKTYKLAFAFRDSAAQ